MADEPETVHRHCLVTHAAAGLLTQIGQTKSMPAGRRAAPSRAQMQRTQQPPTGAAEFVGTANTPDATAAVRGPGLAVVSRRRRARRSLQTTVLALGWPC